MVATYSEEASGAERGESLARIVEEIAERLREVEEARDEAQELARRARVLSKTAILLIHGGDLETAEGRLLEARRMMMASEAISRSRWMTSTTHWKRSESPHSQTAPRISTTSEMKRNRSSHRGGLDPQVMRAEGSCLSIHITQKLSFRLAETRLRSNQDQTCRRFEPARLTFSIAKIDWRSGRSPRQGLFERARLPHIEKPGPLRDLAALDQNANQTKGLRP